MDVVSLRNRRGLRGWIEFGLASGIIFVKYQKEGVPKYLRLCSMKGDLTVELVESRGYDADHLVIGWLLNSFSFAASAPNVLQRRDSVKGPISM